MNNEIKVGDCFRLPEYVNTDVCVTYCFEEGGYECLHLAFGVRRGVFMIDSDFQNAVRITPEEFKERMEVAFAEIRNEMQECWI